MINVVIFGAPGSGKGTQSQLLIEKYGLKHVSTGDILRTEIKAGTELGKLADSYMSKGHLLPDEVVIGILDELIRQHSDAKGFVFDGFPRTLAQGIELDNMLSNNDTQISLVLSLEVHDEELIDRLLKRGQISGRSDDNRETIESRLKVYYSQTAPLKEFYDNQGKLKIIEGVGTVENIFKSIEKEVDKLIR
ncbi:MAG: adenylate kinase [Dysgonamonadaceae bacterium]|jgi:adenylate kinase|nr:adenylate kinase [Dysgonamonadaceae bacterium]